MRKFFSENMDKRLPIKNKHVSFLIDFKTFNELNSEAYKMYMNLSQYIRLIIKRRNKKDLNCERKTRVHYTKS